MSAIAGVTPPANATMHDATAREMLVVVPLLALSLFIGLVSVALSLVLAPALAAWVGLAGLFALTAVLALVGVAVILWVVPAEPPRHATPARGSLRTVLTHVPMLRLNAGVFVLHAVLLAMWVAVPQMLVDGGLAKAHHWWIYLPTIGASFFVMSATLFPLERRGYLRAVFLGAAARPGNAAAALENVVRALVVVRGRDAMAAGSAAVSAVCITPMSRFPATMMNRLPEGPRKLAR